MYTPNELRLLKALLLTFASERRTNDGIAHILNQHGVTTPNGGSHWSRASVIDAYHATGLYKHAFRS